jgi:hypothetical protein
MNTSTNSGGSGALTSSTPSAASALSWRVDHRRNQTLLPNSVALKAVPLVSRKTSLFFFTILLVFIILAATAEYNLLHSLVPLSLKKADAYEAAYPISNHRS